MTQATGGDLRPRPSPTAWITDRAPIVFVLGLLVAVPVLVYFGRHQWFFLDEWDFLANRSAASPADLFEPHNEHWTSLPLLAYRALFPVVGLHSYVPYQLMVIGLHLLVAWQIRLLIVRVGAGPWLSSLLVVPFVLFGSGWQNIIWAFQISFVGSLAAGLGHLLLADRDGRDWDRRDWIGLGVGVLGLMSSGIAVPMTIGVGLAVFIRRGLPMAIRHTLPLGAVYVGWWLAYGRDGYSSENLGLGGVIDFARLAIEHAVSDIGRLGGRESSASVGWLLALVVGGGLVVWFLDHRREWQSTAAATIGCLAAAVTLLLLTGFGRAELGVPLAEQSRYSHILYALLLPAAGLAVAGYAGRRRELSWVAVAVLLIGVPGNIGAFRERDLQRRIGEGESDLVLALPRVPEGQEAPVDARPLPTFGFELTMGWLREVTDDGLVPDPGLIEEIDRSEARFRLSLIQRDGPIEGACRSLAEPQRLVLEEGASVSLRGGLVIITELDDGEATRNRMSFFPDFGARLDVDRGPLELEIVGGQQIRRSELCLVD